MNIGKVLQRKKIYWVLALFLILFIRILSSNKRWVENSYSSNFYIVFSKFLRFLFGWIPFSVGDILYLVAGCWLLLKLVKNIRQLFKRKFTRSFFFQRLVRLVFILAAIYITFNIFWGLNYNRKGIGWQLHLPQTIYDTASLKNIEQLLLQKVNASKKALRGQKGYPDNKTLFERAAQCYSYAEKKYPFINYKIHSVKSSMYGGLGNYLGFTGYYNPFTGEAQVNTTVPKFLLPYITVHEIGHQLGYAKEDEANFVGYLAAIHSPDTLFHYSTYLDLYLYANREVFYFDSAASKASASQLLPEVKADILEWKQFNEAHTGYLEPAITWLYGKYLQINQQPKGMRSYNEVIAMLMAYYKKYGEI